MAIDPGVRQDAAGHLMSLFQGIGKARQDVNQNRTPAAGGLAGLGSMASQLQEFMEMPINVAEIFLNMSVQLTEMVLTALEEAGFELVKGLTPM